MRETSITLRMVPSGLLVSNVRLPLKGLGRQVQKYAGLPQLASLKV